MNFFDQNSAPAISGNLANYTFRPVGRGPWGIMGFKRGERAWKDLKEQIVKKKYEEKSQNLKKSEFFFVKFL